MTLTVSAPVRIGAILALVLAGVSFGGFRLLAAGGGAETDVTPKIIEHHPFGPRAATPKPTQKATAKATAKAKAAALARPKPTVNRLAINAAKGAGLPAPLAEALGRHRTVVVSLYDPYSKVDAIAYAEAKAGASLAGVGFVPLNVLSEREVGKLTEQLGLLPAPGILVYVRPARLAAKIGGFADKETVAQAAANAGLGS